MDITGGFIGLGILLAVVWYLAIFGEVKKEDMTTHHSVKKSKK